MRFIIQIIFIVKHNNNMENNCSSSDLDDPINCYIQNCTIDIDKVPVEIIRKSASLYNHRIEGDYIYGVKLVSKSYTHMFANEETPPYEVDKIYYYEDSDRECSKINNFCYTHKNGAHGAGLWANPCFEKSITINNKETLCVPILVRFPLQSTIVLGDYAIKGKIMEIVSIEQHDIEKYLK